MKYPKVSIIIPNFEGEKCLQPLLISIRKQNYPGKIEVILIDNDSNDQSVNMVKKRFPKVFVITLPKNVGYAAAFNLGLVYAEGDIITLCNNDIVFDPSL